MESTDKFIDFTDECGVRRFIKNKDARITELKAERDRMQKEIECFRLAYRSVKELEDKLPHVLKVVTEECGECNGKGDVWVMMAEGERTIRCKTCHGSGCVGVECEKCDGMGRPEGFTENKPFHCESCNSHGYKSKRVPVTPGMEVWCICLGKKYDAKGVGSVGGDRIYFVSGGFNLEKDCYADKLTAELIGDTN